ncbi:MAG: pyrroloquinoline quinone biosynthesis protein PqqE [bacterium]|jgi:pyrroloquinoline quinone biosynthesis protein E|nr:MAG: pyrroloquinoline quinone biosynthesis protein PqqE [bacterium]
MLASRPLTLVAELTYRCPLRCPYCSNPLDCGDARYRRELTTEEWVRVFREARSLGVLQLGLSGGEPLVRRDLEDLVAAAAELGLYSTLVTSAVPLTRERLARLRELGLDHVQISVQDSRPDESDRIAGTRSFERKLEAAEWVKALGFPLTLNVVLHRQNLDRIEEIIDLAERLGADRLELANTQYMGWAMLNRAALLPTREQLERAEKVAAEARSRVGPRMQIIFVLSDYYEDYPKPCMGGWGRRAMVVAPNGDVMPCHGAVVIPGLEFANVRDHPLEWIWFESEAFNRFRGTDWMPEPCRSCDRREIDFGGCRCQALLLTGDAAATDPVCRFSPHHDRIVRAREEAPPSRLVNLTFRSMKPPAPAGSAVAESK